MRLGATDEELRLLNGIRVPFICLSGFGVEPALSGSGKAHKARARVASG